MPFNGSVFEEMGLRGPFGVGTNDLKSIGVNEAGVSRAQMRPL
jgi:hypothetical protein